MERAGDSIEIPVDPGCTTPGGAGVRPMDMPRVIDGTRNPEDIMPNAEAPADQSQYAKELGDRAHNIGVPQATPRWSGNSSGPNPPANKPSGHPALSGQ